MFTPVGTLATVPCTLRHIAFYWFQACQPKQKPYGIPADGAILIPRADPPQGELQYKNGGCGGGGRYIDERGLVYGLSGAQAFQVIKKASLDLPVFRYNTSEWNRVTGDTRIVPPKVARREARQQNRPAPPRQIVTAAHINNPLAQASALALVPRNVSAAVASATSPTTSPRSPRRRRNARAPRSRSAANASAIQGPAAAAVLPPTLPRESVVLPQEWAQLSLAELQAGIPPPHIYFVGRKYLLAAEEQPQAQAQPQVQPQFPPQFFQPQPQPQPQPQIPVTQGEGSYLPVTPDTSEHDGLQPEQFAELDQETTEELFGPEIPSAEFPYAQQPEKEENQLFVGSPEPFNVREPEEVSFDNPESEYPPLSDESEEDPYYFLKNAGANFGGPALEQSSFVANSAQQETPREAAGPKTSVKRKRVRSPRQPRQARQFEVQAPQAVQEEIDFQLLDDHERRILDSVYPAVYGSQGQFVNPNHGLPAVPLISEQYSEYQAAQQNLAAPSSSHRSSLGQQSNNSTKQMAKAKKRAPPITSLQKAYRSDANVQAIMHHEVAIGTFKDAGVDTSFSRLPSDEMNTTFAALNEDGAAGRINKSFLKNATTASSKRAAGEYDAFAERKFIEQFINHEDEDDDDADELIRRYGPVSNETQQTLTTAAGPTLDSQNPNFGQEMGIGGSNNMVINLDDDDVDEEESGEDGRSSKRQRQ
ncbi:hypothetical protein F5884DRAFT_86211 [Xylogone sp. PMI_703]|nr:hypothetical protein F5884DRAFT_86211 [Xylogone sp. PMI_703]